MDDQPTKTEILEELGINYRVRVLYSKQALWANVHANHVAYPRQIIVPVPGPFPSKPLLSVHPCVCFKYSNYTYPIISSDSPFCVHTTFCVKRLPLRSFFKSVPSHLKPVASAIFFKDKDCTRNKNKHIICYFE